MRMLQHQPSKWLTKPTIWSKRQLKRLRN
ncbi:hypothetical protein Goarm_013274 [Gossypium armourianum]|uniref:Uncharacterized protein n=1 Tax=Gossypium armourianum TaxID=34283 RepID=A0A7J9J2L0_9ROSI|nr:hypothetical protein [Gossypium armourianum]